MFSLNQSGRRNISIIHIAGDAPSGFVAAFTKESSSIVECTLDGHSCFGEGTDGFFLSIGKQLKRVVC
jgi:hypothetical protein